MSSVGVDFVLEIHVQAAPRKIVKDNAERYARFGVSRVFRLRSAPWSIGGLEPARSRCAQL